MNRTDVLIIGAGPAGSIAALLLARAGLRVRLLDRARFPRHKLCGDTLNPGALAMVRQFGVAHRIEAAALPIRGMVVTGDDGTEIIGEYDAATRGVALPRRDLDALLLETAIDAGVEVDEHVTVLAPHVSETAGRVRVDGVEIAGTRGRLRLEAPMTIAADGRHSRLAFALGLARHPARPRRWAIGAYFENVAGCRAAFGEMHIRQDQYIGICPVPGGLTNACVVVSDPRAGAIADPPALLSSALSHDRLLGDRFASARMIGRPTVIGPLAVDTTRAGVDGLLLAGDAAGFIDPMTGDGLRFAIKGAELAADVARRSIENPSVDAAGELTRRRAQAFAGKWRLNRALRRLVASPRAIALASSAARLWPLPVQHLIARAGDTNARLV